jgi:hypothetical protein
MKWKEFKALDVQEALTIIKVNNPALYRELVESAKGDKIITQEMKEAARQRLLNHQ